MAPGRSLIDLRLDADAQEPQRDEKRHRRRHHEAEHLDAPIERDVIPQDLQVLHDSHFTSH